MEDSFIQKDIPIIHIFIHLLALFKFNTVKTSSNN